MTERMTIDEFARRMGSSARNVRAYQERGLLAPPVLDGRTGYYVDSHVERFRTVQRLQREGFSLSAIRALFDVWEAGGGLGELMGADARELPAAPSVADTATLFPATKFQPPGVRAEHIPRNRCLAQLSGGWAHHILLTSPGGSGKTILASQLASQRGWPIAWVSLDAGDNEVGAFWAALLLGLRTALPGFGSDLLAAVLGGGDIDRLLPRLAGRLAEDGQQVTLVLDDLHEVDDPTVQRQLVWLLNTVEPRTCGVIGCSRTRPVHGVSALTLKGRGVELRTEDLSFDDAEVRELLQGRLGVALTAAQADEIAAGTDGWAAGVYLAGLALQAGTAADAVIKSLTAPDRRIQDYFEDEVLSTIDPEHLAFLQDIAILDRFTAELCDAVRGRDDSAAVLEELRANMFVIRLDAAGRWQRLHQTFTAVLRNRAGPGDGAVLSGRHHRAADWYREHNLVPEAIGHYVRAQAYDMAAELIAAVYPRFLNISHQGAIVERWLDMLPEHVVAGTAALNLAAACVAGLRGDRGELALRLAAAEALPDDCEETPAATELMRALLNFGEIEQALQHASASYARRPRPDLWYPMQGAVLALLQVWVHGPDDEVLRIVNEVLADEAVAEHPIALAGLWALRANVLAHKGSPGASAALARAVEIRKRTHVDKMPQAANTWSSTARVYRLLGDIDAAAADAVSGHEIVADLTPERDATGAVVPLLIELTYARRLQGRLVEARRYAEEAHRRLRQLTGPGLLPAMLDEAAEGL